LFLNPPFLNGFLMEMSGSAYVYNPISKLMQPSNKGGGLRITDDPMGKCCFKYHFLRNNWNDGTQAVYKWMLTWLSLCQIFCIIFLLLHLYICVWVNKELENRVELSQHYVWLSVHIMPYGKSLQIFTWVPMNFFHAKYNINIHIPSYLFEHIITIIR
jgi:hypothetical protein